MRTAILAAAALALASPAAGHDVWINQERRTNKAGQWCCDARDCKPVASKDVKVDRRGYTLSSGEFVPHADAAVSGDNEYWVCRNFDGVGYNGPIRCFFFPPGGF